MSAVAKEPTAYERSAFRVALSITVERSERQERLESADRHALASRAHTAASARHNEAALRWDSLGDSTRAGFERRSARLEKEVAELEDDRAQFYWWGRVKTHSWSRIDPS